MIDIKNISKENWDNILRTNSADDIETIEYLKEHNVKHQKRYLSKGDEI